MVNDGIKDEFLFKIKYNNPQKKDFNKINYDILNIVNKIYTNEKKLVIINLNKDNFLRGKKVIVKITIYHYDESKKNEVKKNIYDYLINKENIDFFNN